LPIGISKITFAAGELTTGPACAFNGAGLTVKTSKDAVSTGASVPALAGVQSSQLALASADQKALQATTATTNVTFTTQTILPANTGTITITLPANYFTAKASPTGVLVPVSGNAALTGTCTLTKAGLTIVCTLGATDLPIGISKITFAAGELTTGPACSLNAAGLTVKTSADGVSTGASVPALVSGPAPIPIVVSCSQSQLISALVVFCSIVMFL
jgi:hypothetical protein